MTQKNAAEIARETIGDTNDWRLAIRFERLANYDWRCILPNMADRFKYMCLRESYSDVDFVFNGGLPGEMVCIFCDY